MTLVLSIARLAVVDTGIVIVALKFGGIKAPNEALSLAPQSNNSQENGIYRSAEFVPSWQHSCRKACRPISSTASLWSADWVSFEDAAVGSVDFDGLTLAWPVKEAFCSSADMFAVGGSIIEGSIVGV